LLCSAHTAPPLPTPPLFPYTTLFRSRCAARRPAVRGLETAAGDTLGRCIPDDAGGLAAHVPARRRQHHLHGLGAFEGSIRAESADRKSTRLNSSHGSISYAVFCLKKK